jgi:hypothetical protein
MTPHRLLLIVSSLLAGCATPDQPVGLPPHQLARIYEPGHVLFSHLIATLDPASEADTTSIATLGGWVVSQCNERPLPATVRLTETVLYPGSGVMRTVVADAKGDFRFNNLPSGSYQLSATYRGYGALADTIIYLVSTGQEVVDIGLGCPALASP